MRHVAYYTGPAGSVNGSFYSGGARGDFGQMMNGTMSAGGDMTSA